MDQSKLDQKYFIDKHVYNCPFCKRGNVSYYLNGSIEFDWTNDKKCYGILVICTSCHKNSMHLSFSELSIEYIGNSGRRRLKYDDNTELDELFFYSVPTSFFTLDEHIPKILRELFSEAEGCLKSNYLTGASACVRKLIYELAVLEEAEGENYDEKLKSLKKKTEIDPLYFDTLLTIQQVTSAKVHEQSLDGWKSQHIRLMLSTLSEILKELYVLPKIKEQNRHNILDLKERLLGKNAGKQSTN
jgi:hypothetical protein